MKTKNAILNLFKENPHSEYSTSEIVRRIENKEFEDIDEILKEKFTDPEKRKKAQRKKAQLHRKILYYLNEFIKQDILRMTKEGKKGEKYFTLDLEEGEELIINNIQKRNSMTIAKPHTPSIPIEGYEQKGIVHKLDPATWIERLNSILVECPMFKNLNELLHFISTCFSNINDVIALNDFESLFKKYEINQIITFIHKLNSRCSDYGKKITCIFDITNVSNEEDIIKLMKDFQGLKTKNITFIFDIKIKEFQEHSDLFEKLILLFSKTNTHLYLKNQDLHEAPYIIGRAGPYAFDEKEWKIYKNQLQRNINCLVCAHSTIMVDVKRFLQEESNNIQDFKNFNLKITNSLLSANSIQRKRSEEYFNNLVKLNEQYIKNIFIFSKNYIRFWNYGWKREDFDQDFLIELLKQSKKAVNKFCISQETIYKSCGIPTRFRIAFSCAFEEFVKDIFSKAKYKSFTVSSIKDFYKPEIKQILETKEELFKLFDGGDIITIYRTGDLDPKDIIREISFILNTYDIPFFRFNFVDIFERDISLNKFLK